MNLPNKITMFRVLMIPVFIIAYIFMGLNSVVPGLLFVIASLSDAFDGYIARKYNLVTTFGKFMDPLADKILTQAAFIVLVEANMISAWIVVVIVARELIITGFRTIAASQGVTIAASKWGKFKTIFQMLAIVAYLFMNTILLSTLIASTLLYLALIFTIISGIDYIAKNINVLDLSNI